MHNNEELWNNELWNALSAFVSQECEDRDESHGPAHMRTVADTVHKIYHHEYGPGVRNPRIYNLAISAAWLHDVMDHKYVLIDGVKTRITDLLRTFFTKDDTDLILRIIDRVSYSKENAVIMQGGKLDWNEELGPDGCAIRDMVSDADKLEAIGSVGIERCKQFSQEHYFAKHRVHIGDRELIQSVLDHADEKLLRLKSEFIRTDWGKKLAEPLHEEMLEALNKMLEALNKML